MGWKIEVRQLNGKYITKIGIFPDKIKADVALRRAIFQEYGKVWLTPTCNGTILHSSTHNIVLGRMEEVEDTFSEDTVNRELRHRLEEFNATNSS